MFQITVVKKDLIVKIKANREEHRSIFDEAIVGYRAYVTDKLEERIKRLEAGQTIEESFRFAVPEDHTGDYDRVIAMLEMDTNEEITLEEDLYACYVDNDWAWAKNFALQNAGYTTSLAKSPGYGKFLKGRS